MKNLNLVYRFLSVLDVYGVVDFDENKNYKDNDEFYFHLENPEDEDYTVPLRYGYILEDIKAEYESFNLDEYVSLWLNAKRDGFSGVPDAVELVDNGRYIQQVLENIYFLSKKVDRLLNENNKEQLINSIVSHLDITDNKNIYSDSVVECVIDKLGLGFISVDDSYFRSCYNEAVKIYQKEAIRTKIKELEEQRQNVYKLYDDRTAFIKHWTILEDIGALRYEGIKENKEFFIEEIINALDNIEHITICGDDRFKVLEELNLIKYFSSDKGYDPYYLECYKEAEQQYLDLRE